MGRKKPINYIIAVLTGNLLCFFMEWFLIGFPLSFNIAIYIFEICILLYVNYRNSDSRVEWICIEGCILCFVSAVQINYLIKGLPILRIIFAQVSLLLSISVLIWNFQLYSRRGFIIALKKAWHFLKSNTMFLGAIILIVLIRLPQLGNLPRFDAGEYYWHLSNAVSQFEYGSLSMFNMFRLADHASIGYISILSIGEFLFPMKIIGVHLVNIFLGILVFCSIYLILIKLYPECAKKYVIIVSILTTSVPTYLGLCTYLNLDYGIITLWILLICLQIYRKKILMCFLEFLMMNTKENALVIFLGYVFFQIAYTTLSYLKKCQKINIKKYCALLAAEGILHLLFCGIVQLCYMIFNLHHIWSPSYIVNGAEENIKYNYLDFNLDFIEIKIKQYLFLNFNWIFIIFFLCLFLFLIYKHWTIYLNAVSFGILGGYIFNLIFSLLYNTAKLPRYNVTSDVLLVFGCSYLFLGYIKKCKKNNTYSFILFLILILVLQSYITIDPVMRACYPQYSSEVAGLVYCRPLDDEEIILTNDYIVYNNQHSFIDRTYDKILRNIAFDESTLIIHTKWEQSLALDCFCSWGNGRYTWNDRTKRRSFISELSPIFTCYLPQFNDMVKKDLIRDFSQIVIIDYDNNLTIKEIENFKNNYTLLEEKKETIYFGKTIAYYVFKVEL